MFFLKCDLSITSPTVVQLRDNLQSGNIKGLTVIPVVSAQLMSKLLKVAFSRRFSQPVHKIAPIVCMIFIKPVFHLQSACVYVVLTYISSVSYYTDSV